MNCQCPKACTVPMCIDSLQIGTIEAISTAVYVQFQDIITGRVKYVQATSDENGIVVADVSGIKQFLSPDFFYAISILPASLNQCDAYPFTTYGASEQITCVQFQLVNTGLPIESATIVLQSDQASLLADPNTCISIGFGSSKLISELPYNTPIDDDLIPFFKVIGGITSHMKVSDLPGGGMPALPNGQIFVGNISNVASPVAVSGAITIDNTGLTSLDIADSANITGLLQPDNLIGENYVIGDILAANTTTTLTRIADIAVGNVFISGGVGVLPSWGKVNLSGASSHVTGTLAKSNGGWGSNAAFVSTGIAYASSTTVATTSSKLKWNEASATLTIDGGTDSLLNMNGNSVLTVGDTAADMRSDIYIVSNNGNRALNLFSNGSGVYINVVDTPGDLTIQSNSSDQAIFKEGNGLELLTGGIKTIQPSANGAGIWKLGNYLDATGISVIAGKVIEIDIGGTIHYFQPVNATIV